MQGILRKTVQAVLYEGIALSLVTPALAWLFDRPLADSGALALVLSGLAMIWNIVFNQLFEAWVAQQKQPMRAARRRLGQAIGFEGGLLIFLTPLVALWLNISLWDALWTNAGFFVFFLGYSLAFNWGFDRVFGSPRLI